MPRYTVLDRKMAEIYASRVENEEDSLTLDDVPEKIRPLVEELIANA